MVRPWVVIYSAVNLRIRVPCPLCAELPNGPIGLVFLVEKPYKSVGGISVGSLGVS